MSKITMSIVRMELESWLKLKKSIDATPDAKITNFGKYMNEKYNFLNETLSNEANYSIALLLIVRNHVQEIK
jgi:hypothetical protein